LKSRSQKIITVLGNQEKKKFIVYDKNAVGKNLGAAATVLRVAQGAFDQSPLFFSFSQGGKVY